MKHSLQPLPIGVQSFEKIITGNYLYVDKTEFIYNLIQNGQYYFFARPRRFGKSLLVSTLKEIFLGNKHLFEQLWLGQTQFTWEQHPVIHIDFSSLAHFSAQELRKSLIVHLQQVAQDYSISIKSEDTPEMMLTSLTRELARRNKVVILVDEYDKPILDHLNDPQEAKAQREVLKSFYTVIKSLDEHLRFVFLTGVSKFSKTSIFSGLNNLNDISLKPEAAILLGYTETELKDNFADYITSVAKSRRTSKNSILQEMQTWYNGYRFSRQRIKVYNPFSVLYYLKDKELGNYWFETGTPSFLVELLKEQYESLENIDTIEWSAESLGTFDIESLNIIIVLFQTGYLTIDDYNKHTRKYILDYPNLETSESFKKYLVAAFTHTNSLAVEKALSQLETALKNNNIPAFCATLQQLFANIPYQLHSSEEKYYHSLFQFLGSLLSLDIQSEISTDKGRIDLVITTKKYIYIFEIKFNVSAKIALEQIDDRRYFERYINKKKKIVLVGISFNRDKQKLSLDYAFRQL